MKTCKDCGTDTTSKWLKGPTCNRCYHKDYRNRHPAKARASENKSSKAAVKRYNQIRYRCTKENISYNITLEEYKLYLMLPCYYCNNKLGKPVVYSIGLDRIDNSKGYDNDNVVPCCGTCNLIRGTSLTVDEMLAVANLVINMRRID